MEHFRLSSKLVVREGFISKEQCPAAGWKERAWRETKEKSQARERTSGIRATYEDRFWLKITKGAVRNVSYVICMHRHRS